MTHADDGSRPRRVIIWGPGEIGGSALRAAHADDRFEIVGVKVFSPHKDGVDAGDLVGIGPIGVRATSSKKEILALDADCVILAPLPTAILEGLDTDVIDLLESGKSVVTTAAYHNVAMPNWYTSQSATALLRELSRTPGVARSAAERRRMAFARPLTAVPALDPWLDRMLARAGDKHFPARATPAQLVEACRRGNSSLHGTGVHPTYMVERQIMQLCRTMPDVSHVRFVEAVDFGHAPDGMWGGLEAFGFGRDPAEIGDDWFLAKAGDFYYGDLTGNVGHALYSAGPADIRVERSLRGLPAKHDLQVGSTFIKAGTVAVMHMTHRGFIGEHHFFTNEECWYLTPDNLFHGDDLPFGGLPDHGGYSFDITGRRGHLRGQISSDLTFAPNAITTMSVQALLSAVGPVCDSVPGVVIDGAGLVEGRSSPGGALVRGAGPVADIVRLSVSATSAASQPACVIFAGGPSDLIDGGEVVSLLEAGTNVVASGNVTVTVSDLEAAARRGAATFQHVDMFEFILERMLATAAQGASSVSHLGLIELMDQMPSVADGDLPALVASLCGSRGASLAAVTAQVSGAEPSQVTIEHETMELLDGRLHLKHEAFVHGVPFVRAETRWCRGARDGVPCASLPYGNLAGSLSYAAQIESRPASSALQFDYVGDAEGDADTDRDPAAAALAQLLVHAAATLSSASPGVRREDPRPQYLLDPRVSWIVSGQRQRQPAVSPR
ncbi:MAG: hypothetical protein HYX32_12320 [Actinobacteria bacterium]|nr:hypothetical protein [Actinomycetota bacterium]